MTWHILDRIIVTNALVGVSNGFVYAVQEEVLFILSGLIYTNCHNYRNLIVNN